MSITEPTGITPESVCEDALANAVRDILQRAGRTHLVVNHFGLDVAAFITSPVGVSLRLIEVKVYMAQRQGGIPFGNGRGEGAQVVLLASPDAFLHLLRPTVRWVFGNALLPPGSARYACIDSETAKAAAMGGVSKGKHNNFRESALRPYYREWPVLLSEIEVFLLA